MRIPAIIFILTISQTLFSQDGWYPGYVILNNGDTLQGKVMDRSRDAERIFKKIRFRSEEGGRHRYSPHDIQGYRVGETDFESLWYEETSAFFVFNYYHRYGVGEKVFMRVLRRGKLSCYYLEYVDFDSGSLEGVALFLRQGDDYFERATQGIFGLRKKRLSAYFADCSPLVQKIQNGEIRRPLEVVDYYNRLMTGE